jgi:hypothetical protein
MLKLGYLLVKRPKSALSDGLPLFHGGGAENPVDLIQGQTSLLQHPDEDEPAEGLSPVAALARMSGVGPEQPLAFVVPDGGGAT